MQRRISFLTCVLVATSWLTVRTQSPIALRIVFSSSSLVAAAVRDGAVDETARIWAPYGVTVTGDLGDDAEPLTASLVVQVDQARSAGDGDNGLGEIRFGADGIPEPSVTLYYRPLLRAVTRTGASTEWPAALQDRLLARAMGRALAHEVGHFVLRSPHHADRGLMRARQHESMLTDPSRTAFALTPLDRARLQIVFAAQPVPVEPPQEDHTEPPLRSVSALAPLR